MYHALAAMAAARIRPDDAPQRINAGSLPLPIRSMAACQHTPASNATAKLASDSILQEKTPISIFGINLPSGDEYLVIRNTASAPAPIQKIMLDLRSRDLR